MIFYFSGTGNSQLAAKQIAEELGDELISINQSLKEGNIETFRSERPLVFVMPIYAWRIPKVVESWISKMRFEGCTNAYFILTRGGNTAGNAAHYARHLCKKNSLTYRGLATVHMPENYIALASVPSERECETIIAQARSVYANLANLIEKREMFPEEPVSFRDRVLSGPIRPLYYSIAIHDKGFTVSNACVSCGKCAKRCPLKNIEMESKKPVWKGHCTHCMACICGCPTEAIEYKSISRGKRRYYIMED